MYSAAHKNTARILVLTFLTSSHNIRSVSIHFINPLLTRRAQDFDFKSHLRVWKPLLSSKCLALGHCYYYMLICIYIFCLEAALYLLSPICFFFPDTEDEISNQCGTSARTHSCPHPHYLPSAFLNVLLIIFQTQRLKARKFLKNWFWTQVLKIYISYNAEKNQGDPHSTFAKACLKSK